MKRLWGPITKATACSALACVCGVDVLADRVELTNGDTLSGRLIEQGNRSLTLKHPVLGTVVLPADRVKAVVLDQTEGQANAQDRGKPEAMPKGGKPTPARSDAAARADYPADHSDDPGGSPPRLSGFERFFSDWQSQLSLGFNGAGGNTDRRSYYAKLSTTKKDGRDRWGLNARYFNASASGRQTQNQFDANLTRDWLQEESPWFFFVKGQYKYDDNRDWQNRTSGFGGGGYTLKKTDDVEVNTRLGFGGTYEFGDINQFTPEALFGGSVVKWDLTDRAAVQGEAIYYPSLEDTAAFRVESSLEWTYKLDLSRGMSFKLGLESEYVSEVTGQDDNNDFKYFGAVVFKF